jgi:YVTN family beta-propeller protein
MDISIRVAMLILTLGLLSPGCQTSPRVPEIVATVKVKMFGGSGVIATNPKTGYVYVAGSSHITILKGKGSISEVETGGKEATSIAVDEANDLVYVVNQDSDNVTVIRGTERIGIVPTVGRSPSSVAVEPNNHLAYIVSGYRDRPLTGDSVGSDILVLSGNQVVDNLKIRGRVLLTQVVADPVGGYIYATSAGDDVIVIKGEQEVARYKTPPSFATMTVNSRTGEAYVLSGQTLYRFKDGKPIDSVELNGNMGTIYALLVHPATRDIYAPYMGHEPGMGHVLVLRNMEQIGDLKVGEGPHAATIDPLTGNVYVASFWDNTVTIINGTQILATIKVGWYPYNIGINPTNGWVYVSNINDGTVTVLGYPQSTQTVPEKMGTTPIIPNRATPAPYP